MRLREALALGALHGPAELLPISSSAHTELVPGCWAGTTRELDPDLRKAFEVALHAGTAAALLIALRDEVGEAVAASTGGGSSCWPARSCRPRRGARARAADRAAARHAAHHCGRPAGRIAGDGGGRLAGRADRSRDDAGSADALALGLAQACALMPGVSRNGATLTAARLRGFAPRRRKRPLASRRAADHRRRHRAEGRAPGAAAACPASCARRFAAGIGAVVRLDAGRRRLVRRRAGRCGRSPPTAGAGRPWSCWQAWRGDERRLRRRRRRHLRVRPRASMRSSAC